MVIVPVTVISTTVAIVASTAVISAAVVAAMPVAVIPRIIARSVVTVVRSWISITGITVVGIGRVIAWAAIIAGTNSDADANVHPSVGLAGKAQ
jgi:hypothetical protein